MLSAPRSVWARTRRHREVWARPLWPVFGDYTARPHAAASLHVEKEPHKQKKGLRKARRVYSGGRNGRARRLRLAPRQGRPAAAALGSVGAEATQLSWQAASARQTNAVAQERRKSAWSDQEAKVGAEAIWATPKHVYMHVRRPCLPENEEAAGASAFEEGSTCHQTYPFPPISAAAIRPSSALIAARATTKATRSAPRRGFARQSVDRSNRA